MTRCEKWIKDNEENLMQLRDSYKTTYVTYEDTQIHFDVFEKAMSEVDKYFEDEVFESERAKFFAENPYTDRLLDSGFKFDTNNTNDMQATYRALFWTLTSFDIVMTGFTTIKFVDTIRQQRLIQSQNRRFEALKAEGWMDGALDLDLDEKVLIRDDLQKQREQKELKKTI